jgi:hypothetical protein
MQQASQQLLQEGTAPVPGSLPVSFVDAEQQLKASPIANSATIPIGCQRDAFLATARVGLPCRTLQVILVPFIPCMFASAAE